MKTTTELTKTNGQLFNSIVKGKNFMTPYLLGYYTITNGEAELTEGTGFNHDLIFGVTIVQNGQKADDLSQCFDDINEAKEYIQSLTVI